MIELHTGGRAELAALFRIADDSARAIAAYFDLGDVLVARVDAEAIVGACPDDRSGAQEPCRPGAMARFRAPTDVRVWRPVAIAHHRLDLLGQLDRQDARTRLQLGDVASAHADLLRLWQGLPPTKAIVSRRITGEVVNAEGRAVAGATVTAGSTPRVQRVRPLRT